MAPPSPRQAVVVVVDRMKPGPQSSSVTDAQVVLVGLSVGSGVGEGLGLGVGAGSGLEVGVEVGLDVGGGLG